MHGKPNKPEPNLLTVEKHICKECGIYTISNLANCTRCGHPLEAITKNVDEDEYPDEAA